MSKAVKELRSFSNEELLKKLDDLRKEQFKLNASRASGAAQQDVAKFKTVRKSIARVYTLLGEAKASLRKSTGAKKANKKPVSKKTEKPITKEASK